MSEQTSVALQGLRILLAEDAPANQVVTAKILEKHGHHVMIAADGQEAIAAWERDRFDAILMDLQMPRMDGLAAAMVIRRRETELRRPRTPIVGLSGSSAPLDQQRCLEAGMDTQLVKPIGARELIATIERAVSSQFGHTASASDPQVTNTVCDIRALVTRLEGDTDLVRTLISVYLEDRPRFLAQAAMAIERQDAAALTFAAHRLHGLLRNLEAVPAAEVARHLEQFARQADFAEAARVHGLLGSELERLDEVVKTLNTTL